MGQERRKQYQRTAYEQARRNQPHIVQFFERLEQRLTQNGVYSTLKIWRRWKITPVTEFVFDSNIELYLSRPLYANWLVRFAYWPLKLFGVELPFVARTHTSWGIPREIEIGDAAVLEEAKFTMRQIRQQHPDFTIRLVTPSTPFLQDELNDPPSPPKP